MVKRYTLPIKEIEGYIPPSKSLIYSDYINNSKGDKFIIEFNTDYYTIIACVRDGKVMFSISTYPHILKEFQGMFDVDGMETDILIHQDDMNTLIEEDTIKFYVDDFYCRIDKKSFGKVIDLLPII